MNVRICSCPARDKRLDEEKHINSKETSVTKREILEGPPSKKRKVKVEKCSQQFLTIPVSYYVIVLSYPYFSIMLDIWVE